MTGIMTLQEFQNWARTQDLRNQPEEHPDEIRHTIQGKPVSSDTYYHELGKHVEEHPIHNPIRRN